MGKSASKAVPDNLVSGYYHYHSNVQEENLHNSNEEPIYSEVPGYTPINTRKFGCQNLQSKHENTYESHYNNGIGSFNIEKRNKNSLRRQLSRSVTHLSCLNVPVPFTGSEFSYKKAQDENECTPNKSLQKTSRKLEKEEEPNDLLIPARNSESTNGEDEDDFEIRNPPSPVIVHKMLVSSIDKRMLGINKRTTNYDTINDKNCRDRIYIHEPQYNQDRPLNSDYYNNITSLYRCIEKSKADYSHVGIEKKMLMYPEDTYSTLGVDGFKFASRRKVKQIESKVNFNQSYFTSLVDATPHLFPPENVSSSKGYIKTHSVWESPPLQIQQDVQRLRNEFIKLGPNKRSSYHRLELLNIDIVIPRNALDNGKELILGRSSNLEDLPNVEDDLIESDVFQFLPHKTKLYKRILIRFPLRYKERTNLNNLKLLYSNTDFNSNPNWTEVSSNFSKDGSQPVYYFNKTHCFLSINHFCMYCVISGSSTNYCPFQHSIPLTVCLYGLYKIHTNVLQLITTFQDNSKKPSLPNIPIGTLLDQASVCLNLKEKEISYEVYTEDDWAILGHSTPRQEDIIQIPAMATCPFVKYQMQLQPQANRLNPVKCEIVLKQGDDIITTLFDASNMLNELTDSGKILEEIPEKIPHYHQRNVPEKYTQTSGNSNNIRIETVAPYFLTNPNRWDIPDDILDEICSKIDETRWHETFNQLDLGFTDNVTPEISINLMMYFWFSMQGNSFDRLIDIFERTGQDKAVDALREYRLQGQFRQEIVGESRDDDDDTKLME